MLIYYSLYPSLPSAGSDRQLPPLFSDSSFASGSAASAPESPSAAGSVAGGCAARERYVAGLRAAADFFARHPDVPVPTGWECSLVLASNVYDDKAALAAVMRGLGNCRKSYLGNTFTVSAEISPGFALKFISLRDKVCTATVVGFREVPEQRVEAHVVPARREEILEWACSKPVLGVSR